VKPDETTAVYEGEHLSVTRERWGVREREVVHRADVAAIVAVDTDGCVTLVRQVREAARRPLLEIPAGRIEGDDGPLETAKRELKEETGLHGGRWQAGPIWWTTPGFCSERVHLYFAEELEQGEAHPEEGEELEIVRWPCAELASRIGELDDAKTLLGLLLYLAELERRAAAEDAASPLPGAASERPGSP
jgi:ADP-ribose pyrophosphatase